MDENLGGPLREAKFTELASYSNNSSSHNSSCLTGQLALPSANEPDAAAELAAALGYSPATLASFSSSQPPWRVSNLKPADKRTVRRLRYRAATGKCPKSEAERAIASIHECARRRHEDIPRESARWWASAVRTYRSVRTEIIGHGRFTRSAALQIVALARPERQIARRQQTNRLKAFRHLDKSQPIKRLHVPHGWDRPKAGPTPNRLSQQYDLPAHIARLISQSRQLEPPAFRALLREIVEEETALQKRIVSQLAQPLDTAVVDSDTDFEKALGRGYTLRMVGTEPRQYDDEELYHEGLLRWVEDEKGNGELVRDSAVAKAWKEYLPKWFDGLRALGPLGGNSSQSHNE
jgi:hypothetical protein